MNPEPLNPPPLKEALGKADVPGKTALILSSWFCVGFIPKAPGTFGTIAAVPLVFGMTFLGEIYGGVCLCLFIVLAVLVSGKSREMLGRDDPQEVVIDEVAGFLLTLFLLPLSGLNLALGFVLFRMFDILKPLPIKHSEKIGGGIGIVLDDLIAGVFAHVCLRAVTIIM